MSKLSKLAKPSPPLLPNAPLELTLLKVGPCELSDGRAFNLNIKTKSCGFYLRIQTCVGLGGAGLGGGCLAFFGGSAGLGDSGRGGGPDFCPRLELGLSA